MQINKKDIIRFKKGLKVEFTELGWKVRFETLKFPLNYASLIILDIFSKWISIDEGCKLMAEKCKQKNDFLNVSSDFHTLLKKGFFEIKDDDKNTFGFHNGKFDSFPVHVRMLNDTARTLAFQKAIRETVTPNDIVLDIGTGNGILAATAAMAGAKHVYAVERTEFIEVARAVFKANGLEDKITLIKGDSTKIELPEKASILVSEIIGNDAFQEGILSTYQDAKKRFLTNDARIIPQGLSVFVQAVEIPNEKYNESQVSNENINSWKSMYGVDFSAFQDFLDPAPVKVGLKNTEMKNCALLSDAIKVAEINFMQNDFSVPDFESEFVINKNGNWNGFIIYFEAELNENNTLSLAPDVLSLKNSWANQFYCLPISKSVKTKDVFAFQYRLNKLKSVIEIK